VSESSRERALRVKTARRLPAPDRDPPPGRVPRRKKPKPATPFHVVGPNIFPYKPQAEMVWFRARTRDEAERYIEKQQRSRVVSGIPALAETEARRNRWYDSLRVVDTRAAV
jgi:hypothetical protein